MHRLSKIDSEVNSLNNSAYNDSVVFNGHVNQEIILENARNNLLDEEFKKRQQIIYEIDNEEGNKEMYISRSNANLKIFSKSNSLKITDTEQQNTKMSKMSVDNFKKINSNIFGCISDEKKLSKRDENPFLKRQNDNLMTFYNSKEENTLEEKSIEFKNSNIGNEFISSVVQNQEESHSMNNFNKYESTEIKNASIDKSDSNHYRSRSNPCIYTNGVDKSYKKYVTILDSISPNNVTRLKKFNSSSPSHLSNNSFKLKHSSSLSVDIVRGSLKFNSINNNIKKEFLNMDKKDLLNKYIQINRTNSSSNNSKNLIRIDKITHTKLNNMKVNISNEISNEKHRYLKKKKKVEDTLSDNDEIEYKQKIKILHESKYFINPDSSLKKYWDFIIILLTLYSLIFAPYYVAFYSEDLWFITIMEAIFDLIFITDLILNFFVAYYNYEEELIKNLSLIVINYIQTWFILDLISSIPGSIIVFMITLLSQDIAGKKFTSINKATKFARFYRIIKFTKFFKILKISKSESSKKFKVPLLEEMHLNTSLQRFLIFIYSFLVVSHMITCIWIFLGKSFQPNWILYKNLLDSSDYELYVTSLYFHWATIFTVGYGDITPSNTVERIYGSFLLFVGILTYSFAVSSLGNIFSKYDSLATRYYKNKEILEQLRLDYNLPEPSYQKLAKFLRYDFKFNKNEKFVFINELPAKLKHELLSDMYKDIIKNFIFFRCATTDLTAKIVFCMRPLRTYRREYIIIEGEYLEEVYFIRRGVLSAHLGTSHNESKLMDIRKNEHFGDILILNNEKSPVTIKVKSKVADLLIIRKKDFIDTAKEFSEVFEDSIISSFYNYTSLLEIIDIKKRKVEKEMKRQEYFCQLDNSIDIFPNKIMRDFNENEIINKLKEIKTNSKNDNSGINSKNFVKNSDVQKELLLKAINSSKINERKNEDNINLNKSEEIVRDGKNEQIENSNIEKIDYSSNSQLLPTTFNLPTNILGIPFQNPLNMTANTNDNNGNIFQSQANVQSGTFNFNFIIQNNNYINNTGVKDLESVMKGPFSNRNLTENNGGGSNKLNQFSQINQDGEVNLNIINNTNLPVKINEKHNIQTQALDFDSPPITMREIKCKPLSTSNMIKSNDDINFNYFSLEKWNKIFEKNEIKPDIKLRSVNTYKPDHKYSYSQDKTEESILNKDENLNILDIKIFDETKLKKYFQESRDDTNLNKYNKINDMSNNHELDMIKNFIYKNYKIENDFQIKKIINIYHKLTEKFSYEECYKDPFKLN